MQQSTLPQAVRLIPAERALLDRDLQLRRDVPRAHPRGTAELQREVGVEVAVIRVLRGLEHDDTGRPGEAGRVDRNVQGSPELITDHGIAAERGWRPYAAPAS